MNKKESLNGNCFQLMPWEIFISHDGWALTKLGSILEGIKSIKEDPILLENGENRMSDSKRREWEEEIDNKFKQVGKIKGLEIPKDRDVRESLIDQHNSIVSEQRRLLHREIVVTKE